MSPPLWHYPPALPEAGRQIVAVYPKGDGAFEAALILYDDEAATDAMAFVMWAYLPTNFRLWTA